MLGDYGLGYAGCEGQVSQLVRGVPYANHGIQHNSFRAV